MDIVHTKSGFIHLSFLLYIEACNHVETNLYMGGPTTLQTPGIASNSVRKMDIPEEYYEHRHGTSIVTNFVPDQLSILGIDSIKARVYGCLDYKIYQSRTCFHDLSQIHHNYVNSRFGDYT